MVVGDKLVTRFTQSVEGDLQHTSIQGEHARGASMHHEHVRQACITSMQGEHARGACKGSMQHDMHGRACKGSSQHEHAQGTFRIKCWIQVHRSSSECSCVLTNLMRYWVSPSTSQILTVNMGWGHVLGLGLWLRVRFTVTSHCETVMSTGQTCPDRFLYTVTV